MLERLKLQLLILRLQLQVLLLRQKLTIPNLGNPIRVILHHAAGYLDFEGVNEYHRKKWGFKSSLGYYIGYQYFIDLEGNIHQGRRDTEEGAHTKYYNKQSIGICLMGNGVIRNFNPAQYQSLEKLVKEKNEQYGLLPIFPHSDFVAIECPSNYLRNWIKGR